MIESSVADAVNDEQETGIHVDLDADDGKAVTRAKPRTAAVKPRSWADEKLETNKAVKLRFAALSSRFNQQLAEQQADHQRQIADLEKRFTKAATNGDATTTDEAAHQKAMDALQTELEEAQERGDSKAASTITRKMGAAEAKFWADKTAAQTHGASENAARANGNGTAAVVEARKSGDRKPTAAGVAWAKANGEWWNDTVDDTAIDARAYANSIHHRMLSDGEYDPETPEYFEVIRKQVAKRFPEIETKSTVKGRRKNADLDGDFDEADDPDALPVRRAAAASLPNRGAPTRGESMRTLNRADIATMRSVNLNPDNDKHVLQFLRSKQETEADNA
jgi:hypothetical protein